MEQGAVLSPGAASSWLATAEPVTPGRDGTVIDDGLAARWGGNCYRCGQSGHWYGNCLLRSRAFPARDYGSVCHLCGGSLREGDLSCYGDGNVVVHVRCQVGRVTVEQRANEARLTDASRAASSSPSSQPVAGDEDFVSNIEKCVEESSCNIGVNSAAGSGKTHLICTQAARLQARGERCIGLTFNRDAAQELRDRGFAGARTFHSLAGKAWQRVHSSTPLVHDDEEDEEAAEAAAAQADELDAEEAPTEEAAKAAKLPRKTKMLLRELYPDEPGHHGQPIMCLEVQLFEPFVSHMLTIAKMGAVGIPTPAGEGERGEGERGEGILTTGGRDDNDATWAELERQFEVSCLIERVLMADRPEKSKLGHARHAEALRRWPTPVSRTQKGLRMAREAFAASITIASCRSWHIEHLGCTVRKLTSFKRNGQVLKEYALPCLDWDDVLYMTELEKLPLDPGPSDNETPGPLKWVFADEAQDTSRIRQLMIKRLAGRTARVFVVGDDMQALYGFAGVDPDALSNLFKLFEMAVFDLPVCRRCPVSHIAAANAVKNAVSPDKADVKPMPNAPEGVVVSGADFKSHPLVSTALTTVISGATSARATHTPPTQPEKAIIARRNAPLLACLYALASRGISCEMLGKAPLSKKLLGVLTEIKPSDLGSLESGLDAYVRRHHEARAAAESGGSEYTHEDLARCVLMIIDDLDRQSPRERNGAEGEAALEAVRKEIESKFGSTQQVCPPDRQQLRVVQLGTVHKAKGLGWKWVYWLQPKDIPLDFVVRGGGWRARQERNAEYVALTRSFMHLIKLRHIDVSQTGGLRQGIEALFGDTGTPAGSGGASSDTHAPEDASHAWEQAHPFEWYRREFASRQQHRRQQAAEEAGTAGTAMTPARACELLGLQPPPAPLLSDEVISAYRRAAKQCHPDKGALHHLSVEQATARMQDVNEAKDVLMREIMAEQDLQ